MSSHFLHRHIHRNRTKNKVEPTLDKLENYKELRRGRYIYIIRHTPVNKILSRSSLDEIHELWTTCSRMIDINRLSPPKSPGLHATSDPGFSRLASDTDMSVASQEITQLRSIFSENRNLKILGDMPNYRNAVKTLFFLHGVGGSSQIWKHQLDYFEEENYTVITMDMLGHGYSDAPLKAKHYTFHEISEDVEALFMKYHSEENIVIGHSYGCSFAAFLAHQHSNLITHLVLISGGSPTPLAPQPSVFCLPVMCVAGFRPCIDYGFKKKAIADINSSKEAIRKSTLNVPSYVLHHMMQGQMWNDGDEEYHNEIHTPTLIIHGELDAIISLDMDELMEKTIPGARLVVVNASSHMVMMEKPDLVNKLIHRFIDPYPFDS